jgi:hypothetical protein
MPVGAHLLAHPDGVPRDAGASATRARGSAAGPHPASDGQPHADHIRADSHPWSRRPHPRPVNSSDARRPDADTRTLGSHAERADPWPVNPWTCRAHFRACRPHPWSGGAIWGPDTLGDDA